jgi:hypothetical protein
MIHLESDITWIKRGKQKSAVAQALRRPMTPNEIWWAARTRNHHIQLRDVWFILRQGKRRGLICCFSKRELTGKVYYWTDHGRAVVQLTFGIDLAPRPQGIRWAKYSFIMRSQMRRLVLLELAHPRLTPVDRTAATQIRRRLNERHPACLNSVIRALRELRDRKLVEIIGEGEKRGQKIYRLTPDGQRISRLLQV